MPHVITQSCCNDAACVPVCPVDCIHPRPDEPDFATAEMLYIDPDGCIDCGACVSICPVTAIAADDDLRPDQEPFLRINEDYFTDHPRVGLAPMKERAADAVPLPGRRVAMIGAGPAAMYTVEELVRHPGVAVDVLDQLPTPWGLVRAGVAPDHPSTKGVEKVFAKVAAHPSVRLLLNVEVGADVTVEELTARYDAVVAACGSATDRRLGLEGEDLPGCHAATDLVAWYNGHPDAPDGPDLSEERVVIVGSGNVALDVARILLADPDQLARTDISDRALEALRASKVREVVLLARRGIAHAACTLGELVALGDLAGVDVTVDADERELYGTTYRESLDSVAAGKLRVVRDLAARAPTGAARRLVLRFMASPREILAVDGRVSGLSVTRTRLDAEGAAQPTDTTQTLPAGLVVRAIGYRGAPVAGLPFDESTGTVPHDGGRVLDRPGGSVVPGLYTAGWIKRGPSGGIGANKACGRETARAVAADLGCAPPAAHPGDLVDLLVERGVVVVDEHGWFRIDTAEVAAGRPLRRPRVKITDRRALLASADGLTSTVDVPSATASAKHSTSTPAG